MANPRQRRKARSGSHRAISHSKHAKRNLKKTPPIHGPKVLQDAWDSRKTVRQNYAALGLIHDLNPSASGGAEPLEETIDDLPPAQVAPDSEVAQASASTKLPQGYGRIIRDDAGNVLRVELPEQDQEGDNPNSPGRDIDMETLEPDVDQKVLQKWVADLGGSETRRPTGKDGDIVKELERLSAVPTNKTQTTLSIALTGSGPRHTAKGELEYLLKLVEKHGKDAEKMAKDRKLNPDQRTTGELRRALKRAGLT
ncbi:ribosome biogenesis protein Nop16 [Desarmillaria tabescens]|uniref:Nucleolar protein 16 n=1 Tax=Armillaria tabescens TaxID=1929756 RepID=A0AA39JX88_ARMTA|nr:ribosome biogenesis protein Nop16 [Desarmillaria tabescens]KAK0448288.1 ribosome biogenesis protein Nop16 [Desarmillaria tabescens]